MLEIKMLGTGGTIPIPERYLSSMIISFKGRKILIDAGEGTQIAMREFHTGFRSLDIICLTHFHGDHIFGLPGLIATISNSNRIKPITIIGPRGLKGIIDGLLSSLEFLNMEINIIENPDKNLYFILKDEMLKAVCKENNDYDIVISSLKLQHSADCIGYSFYVPRSPSFDPEKAKNQEVPIELWSDLQRGKNIKKDGKLYKSKSVLGEKRGGIKLSFITDTRPIESIIEFIKDSDLFVCEGTYGDDKHQEKAMKTLHMTFREASSLAKEANVKKLLLTHFSTRLENPEKYISNARGTFKNTIIAYDGYKLTLSYED